jgi:hypothetical protein
LAIARSNEHIKQLQKVSTVLVLNYLNLLEDEMELLESKGLQLI